MLPQQCKHAPTANLPISAQLAGIPYNSPKLHPGPCNSVGMRPRTERQSQTHRCAWPEYISRRLRLARNAIYNWEQACKVHMCNVYISENCTSIFHSHSAKNTTQQWYHSYTSKKHTNCAAHNLIWRLKVYRVMNQKHWSDLYFQNKKTQMFL